MRLSIKNRNNMWSFADKITAFSIVLMITYFSLPIMYSFDNVIRIAISGAFMTLFYLSVLLKNRYFFFKLILVTFFLILFNLLVYFSQWSGKVDFAQQMYFLFLFWFPFIIMIYIIRLDDRKLYKLIIMTTLSVMFFTSITTIIGLIINPMASRILATSGKYYDLDTYYRMNIGGYDFIYSMVLMIPVLQYLIRNKKKSNSVYLLTMVVFTICIFLSQYTIAIILTLMTHILFFFKTRNQKIIFFSLSPFLVLMYFLIQPNIGKVFYDFSNILIDNGYTMVSKRFREIWLALSNSHNNYELTRITLYKSSLNTFVHYPLTGVLFKDSSAYIPGGHSSILDTLGYLGVMGFLWIAYFYRMFLSRVKKTFRDKKIYSTIKYMLFLIVILATINTIFSSPLLSTVIFIVSYSASYIEKTDEIKHLERRRCENV